MDKDFDNRRRIGSVKAVINMYGERILEGHALKKSHMDFPEKSSRARARELHRARSNIGRLNESRRDSESVKAQAESELRNAKKTVKDLSSLIEESNSKAKSQMREVETLKKSGRKIEQYQYEEVMRELEFVKQDLSKLKLDIASVLEEKSRAEKVIEASSSKTLSNSSSVDALRKEIEEVNEEHVLVELARIEALKELGAIEAQRGKEANDFSFTMGISKRKMKDLIEEIDQSKELETKLAVTMSDVNVLQNELMLVKEMDKRVQRIDSLKRLDGSLQRGEEMGVSPLLQSVTEELEAAKKELASIREEGFQFMASMDIIRNELKHVTQETARLKKTEEKTDLTVQNFNSKLLRAKSKLEAVTAAEEKAKSIASNLSLTLQQLKTEAEAAKKEKALISEETAAAKAEIQKTESEIDLNEERLQVAMQELEAVKSKEVLALENLKTLTEGTVRARASASQYSSSITISNFEYEYLTGRAVGAEEIADKKVAAAQAWIEAIKASEKEILMKTEKAHREVREKRVEEEQQVLRTEKSLSAKRMVEGELRNWRQKRENNTEAEKFQPAVPRKTMKDNGNLTPARRAKLRKSASPAIRHMARSSSFSMKKRKKVMPNLAKIFSGKRINKVS